MDISTRQRVAGLLRKAAFQGQLPRVKELLQGLGRWVEPFLGAVRHPSKA